MRVYLAGPITHGRQHENVARAVEAGSRLLRAGHEPFVPHLSWYWDRLHAAEEYEAWLRLDLAWLPNAEAVVRLRGYSPGADREVALARSLGIPVFDGPGSVADFLDWSSA